MVTDPQAAHDRRQQAHDDDATLRPRTMATALTANSAKPRPIVQLTNAAIETTAMRTAIVSRSTVIGNGRPRRARLVAGRTGPG
jgi:hypothetical protein